MALADLENRRNTPWQTCETCHALANLPKDKAKRLRALLANELVRYAELETELATDPDWQVRIPREALSRHARGICKAKERLRGGKR